MQVRVSKGADYRYIPRQRFAALPWNQCESVRPLILYYYIATRKWRVLRVTQVATRGRGLRSMTALSLCAGNVGRVMTARARPDVGRCVAAAVTWPGRRTWRVAATASTTGAATSAVAPATRPSRHTAADDSDRSPAHPPSGVLGGRYTRVFWQRIVTSVIINKQGTFRHFAMPVCVYLPPVFAIRHWVYWPSDTAQPTFHCCCCC